jgi:hypothetical protein
MRRPDDVVLHLQIFEEELDRLIVIRLDPPYPRRRQDDDLWFLRLEETINRRGLSQIELGAATQEQTGKSLLLELANERAADEPTMARDEDFVRFFHGLRQSVFTIFFFPAMRNPQFVRKNGARLGVQKTYKLLIGGKFVRSESGRVAPAAGANGKPAANYSRASRKDFRDAVAAARAAFGGWSKQSAYLRSQILYRAAEMLETRDAELRSEVARGPGDAPAATEVSRAIDRLVYYAGWTDKFSSVFGAVNPVASSHFNFTTPEPTGVVVVVCPDESPLLALVSLVAPVILSGNTAVVLASSASPLPALTFSEIIATSDLPAGVVNILAGDRAELAPHFASHMDVNAIVDGSGDEQIGRALQRGGALNVKRYFRRDLAPGSWAKSDAETPYWILDTVEMKTAWHPIGL